MATANDVPGLASGILAGVLATGTTQGETMADDADRADQEIESAITDQVRAASHQANMAPALVPKLHCHYCDESVAAGLRFCNQECAQDFQTEEDQMTRMGRR